MKRSAALLMAVALSGCGGGGTDGGGTQAPAPLTAVIDAVPTEGDAPLAVSADGSASTGNPVTFEWDMDFDGNTFDADATGPTASFTYATFGLYTLALKVTDSTGTVDIATVTISVNTSGNAMPTAALSASPTSGASPLAVTLDASGSADSDGSIVWYLWDYDFDGTFDEQERTASAVNPHTFYFPGDFTVAVKVLDDAGGWDTATVNVSVSDSVVTFPDAGLEAAVRAAIGKDTGDIYASDLEPVTMLDAAKWDPAISDLTNIDRLNNLTWLYISDNAISDLTPVAALKNLRWLYAYNNSLSDITPIAGLKNLKGVFINGNSISDISPLAGLPLLKDVNVADNSVTDISPLSGLPVLLSLEVSGNSLSGGTLPALPSSLTRLTASGCGLSDISQVSSLGNLEWLDVSGNSLSGAGAVSGLSALEYLNLAGCGLSTLPDLSGLGSLIELNVAANPVADWTPVTAVPTLQWLNAAGCGISDASFVSSLTGLVGLYLDGNSISDLTPLSSCAGLATLSLSSNSISDLSPLAGLLSLNFVNLDNNNVADITALVTNSDNGGLGQGDGVILTNNPLSTQAVNNDIPALEANGVIVTY